MKLPFTADFFKANRDRLRLSAGRPLIAVAAHGLLQRSADSSFAFQQDSNFWYVTGIDEPDLILVMTSDEEFLIVPGRSVSRQAFDGTVNADALTGRSGIATVYDETAGWERLTKLIKRHRQLATPLPTDSYIEHYGLYANPARRRFVQNARKVMAHLALADLRPELARLRMIKQPAEVAVIQAAIGITGTALANVRHRLSEYTYEFQIEASLSHDFRALGGRGHAFDPIVAHGHNAVTLHNVANNDKLKAHSLLVMDVGAEVSHYAADITRTVAYGKPTARQRAVYAAVLEVQAAATALIKPGIDLKHYEQQVEQLIGQQLRQLKLIDSDDRAAIRHYYPHATSHFLGLDVHDVGDYQAPLAEGVVMTVEPGIYIPEEGIGVRIEDDVLVTKQGVKVLSEAIPRVLQ